MRVLCLGNNTKLTDAQTRQLAEQNNSQCHGLLSEIDQQLTTADYSHPGYYHSSVYDIAFGNLFELAKQFDRLIVLDQSKDQYSHPDAFYKTVQLANKIKMFTPVTFINPAQDKGIQFFENLVDTNPSFCIFPFIELLANNSYTTVCCRSNQPIVKLSELVDYRTDVNYQTIRQNMLDGIKIPEHCSSCYEVEQLGMISARQQETVEWANRLNLNSFDDLKNIQDPVYFEVRPSNICNLQCRMCNPIYSQLMGKEFLKVGLIDQLPDLEHTDFSMVNLNSVKKLYVAGGEPLAMPEFYDFVDQCIDSGREFEFVVNTNATKINSRFREQLKQLPHVQFIVSIDGYDQLNHYIRWPSDWATIIDNVTYLKKQNHTVSFNVTVSIYNVLTLNQLLQFFDATFPNTLVHCQLAGSPNDQLSAFNFPNRQLVLDNLKTIPQLNCYKNDRLLSSFIDGLITHYQEPHQVDQQKLNLFFDYNDRLDQSRNVQLADYIPELERYR